MKKHFKILPIAFLLGFSVTSASAYTDYPTHDEEKDIPENNTSNVNSPNNNSSNQDRERPEETHTFLHFGVES
ncbi:hypothetical protein QE177_04610 [Arsenophonus sp. aPb]|uniref:hypothetical protein n=1 Tax=Arsenophonus sp. aPb TaxID=3041619 RepID=UPI002469A196|nr:hypothetical protein [Arsenophonus sp. aPb]WGL99168.1 hypothetical protein QE177_04610 [Arsenophonus sp. aPb]